MEQYELYIHSNAVEANCTEIEEQYSSGSRFCRRKQDFLVSIIQSLYLLPLPAHSAAKFCSCPPSDMSESLRAVLMHFRGSFRLVISSLLVSLAVMHLGYGKPCDASNPTD